MSKMVQKGGRWTLTLLGAVLVATLAACGGGGGSAGDPVIGGGGSGGIGGGGSGVGTTPGTPSSLDTATVGLKLSSSTVTAGAPATVTVTVANKAGAAIPGLVVKFTSDAGMAAFSASSALTDANGEASVVLSPAVAAATGADTLRATVNYASKDYSASAGFQLTATNVTIASFTSDLSPGSSLSAYGQANLTVALAGTNPTVPVNLVMTSSCAAAGKGTITPANQTISTGKATFTFRDGGCGASASSENLQISVTGTGLTQSLSLPVSSPAAASIGFVSASPTSIYLRGSGLVENSNVTFQVKDANNNGLPGQTVLFEPSVLVGDLQLDGQTGTVSKVTDSNGNVIVRINSGTVPTPVRIKATLQGSNISTVSSALAIAVGLPSQLNFSLAQGTRNIEGYDVQGTPNTYTIIASDRLGNPVPDGTAINFIAEGGQIQAIKQTALDARGIAVATANYASSNPVPVDGRVTVVAYALGEESFLDVNGNNVYDAGEAFQDLGDLFLDRKFDNFYLAAEDQFISLSTGDAKECVPSSSGLLATNVSIPNRPLTCSQNWGRAYVRRAVETVYSTSGARPLWGSAWHPNAVGVRGACSAPIRLMKDYADDVARPQDYQVFGSGDGGMLYGMLAADSLSLVVADANPVAFNPMAAGTAISAVGTDGLAVSVVGGSPVPNAGSPTGLQLSYKFNETTVQGTITVAFRSPSGLTTSVPIFVSQRDYGAAVKPVDPANPTSDEKYRATLATCSN